MGFVRNAQAIARRVRGDWRWRCARARGSSVLASVDRARERERERESVNEGKETDDAR